MIPTSKTSITYYEGSPEIEVRRDENLGTKWTTLILTDGEHEIEIIVYGDIPRDVFCNRLRAELNDSLENAS